jgi:hypothetical protein
MVILRTEGILFKVKIIFCNTAGKDADSNDLFNDSLIPDFGRLNNTPSLGFGKQVPQIAPVIDTFMEGMGYTGPSQSVEAKGSHPLEFEPYSIYAIQASSIQEGL